MEIKMTSVEAPYLDLTSTEYQTRQYELIEALRRESWYATTDGGYIFFNQREAAYFLGHSDFRFSYSYIDPKKSPYLADRVQGMLLAKHGLDHARLRALLMRALRDRVVDTLYESIREIVDDLIHALPESGEVDLVETYTNRIPERVLGPMLGIEYDKAQHIDEWIRISARSIDTVNAGVDLQAIEQAWRSLEGFLDDLIEERRGNLGSDIFSELIAAENEGDRLNSKELNGITMELARAGVETTRNQLSLTIHQLLACPEQWQRLQADPELASNAVEEGMRFAPLPHVIPQQAIKDHDYEGISIKKGEIAMILVPAANRDPAAYDNSGSFDISRSPKQHYSFGHGTHFCPGANLARMEMQLALEALSRHVQSWRLIQEPTRSGTSSGSVPQELIVEIQRRKS
jgi:cytochrome P450